MELWAIVPELILGGMCLLLVALAGLVRGAWRPLPGAIAIGGVATCVPLTARMLAWEPVPVFEGTYAIDGLATVFKLIVEIGALITLVLLSSFFRRQSHAPHAHVAVVFATLGAVGLTSSLDLGLIVLFLQMLGFASYVLAALVRTDARALEAAIKYFLYGAVALAVMAYGLTFIYGLTGSLDLRAIGRALQGADRVWIAIGLTLVVAGYGFEITMIPFHVWAPDVFSGATAPVGGFLSVVPKAAGLAGLLRFLLHALPGEPIDWRLFLAVAAALTMTFGNLVALRQTSLKRLLAYSSIAHAGYLLMAVAVAGRAPGAVSAVAFYLTAYLFMNIGAFAVAAQLERARGSDAFEAVRGLGRRAPAFAAVLALALLSLAGIPPLGGFAGKVLLLNAALEGGLVWLAVLAAVNMVVALYYYVAVIAEMYSKAPAAPGSGIATGTGYVVTAWTTTAGTLLVGVLPGLPLEITRFSGVLVR